MKKQNDYSPWGTILKRIEAEKYALRNRTQKLIMGEICRYHDLFFTILGKMYRDKYWSSYFRLREYLFKKYKIY